VRVGIIGSGRIGATAARLLVAAGHDVAIANSRGPASLASLVAELGAGARAATVEDAASFGDVVLVAIPFHAAEALPPDRFAGKVVVDANNYFAGRDGSVAALEVDSATSSELLAARLPGARVVKAFNTINYRPLGTEGRPGAPREERLAIPLAGDDEAAKRQVAALIEELGFAALDTGGLAEGGRLQQPGGPFFNRPLRLQDAERELDARHA
jgi:predicted dinucleotide-binding enzyme